MGYMLQSDSNANLPRGQALVSRNGRARFAAQDDGNLCIYAVVGPKGEVRYIWGSGTNGQALGNVCMNSNGEVAAFKPDSADTVWKSGSWNSGQPGPYRLILENDGNLVAYASTNTAIWSLGTSVSPPPVKFSRVRWQSPSDTHVYPLVKDWAGEKELWNDKEEDRALTSDRHESVVDFDRSIAKGRQWSVGDQIGSSGTVCSLGVYRVVSNNLWIDPLRTMQFVYERGCHIEVSIYVDTSNGLVKYNGLQHFEGDD